MSMQITHPQNVFKKREKVNMSDDLVKRLRAIDKDIILRRFDPEMSFDGMTAHKAADRIEKLEAALDEAAFSQTLFDAVVGQRNKATDRIEKLESVTKDDAKWLAAYHKWCEMNGCAPSSSDLISARKALEDKQ